jgi:threonine/homoserine/homoserine lactone efflux protein
VSEFLAFLAVAVVVIVTPGPDTALTIRNTLLGGRRCGILTGVGVSAGQLVWALATSAGLAGLLAASETAFQALRLAGAAYLVFLGGQAIIAALRGDHAPERSAAAGGPGRPLTTRVALRQGLVSNVTNPKMAVFFPSLLPQFAPGGRASFWTLLLLGLVFSLMTLAWLTAYATAVAKAGDVLRGPRIRRLLEGFTGTVLVTLGLRLATGGRGTP